MTKKSKRTNNTTHICSVHYIHICSVHYIFQTTPPLGRTTIDDRYIGIYGHCVAVSQGNKSNSNQNISVIMNSNSHWHHYLIDFNNQKIIHHHTYNVRQDCTSNMELLKPSSQPNEDGYIQLPPPFLGDYRRGRRHAGQLSSQGQKILAHLEHRCADRSGNITTSSNNLPISELRFL